MKELNNELSLEMYGRLRSGLKRDLEFEVDMNLHWKLYRMTQEDLEREVEADLQREVFELPVGLSTVSKLLR